MAQGSRSKEPNRKDEAEKSPPVMLNLTIHLISCSKTSELDWQGRNKLLHTNRQSSQKFHLTTSQLFLRTI